MPTTICTIVALTNFVHQLRIVNDLHPLPYRITCATENYELTTIFDHDIVISN